MWSADISTLRAWGKEGQCRIQTLTTEMSGPPSRASGLSVTRSTDLFVRKSNEPRVFHQGKNHSGLPAPGRAARLGLRFSKTRSGSPPGPRLESLPYLFGSTQAARRRKYRLFWLPVPFL